MANNYKAVFKVVDRIELNRAYTDNGSQVKLSDRENINGVKFTDYYATNVQVTDDTLQQLQNEPAIKDIGTVRVIRYKALDEYRKQL